VLKNCIVFNVHVPICTILYCIDRYTISLEHNISHLIKAKRNDKNESAHQHTLTDVYQWYMKTGPVSTSIFLQSAWNKKKKADWQYDMYIGYYYPLPAFLPTYFDFTFYVHYYTTLYITNTIISLRWMNKMIKIIIKNDRVDLSVFFFLKYLKKTLYSNEFWSNFFLDNLS